MKLFESDSMSVLTEDVNEFLQGIKEHDVVSIKYQSNAGFTSDEILDSFSVMVVYCVADEKKQTGIK